MNIQTALKRTVSLPLLTMAAFAAHADNGTVTFNGYINEAPCSITSDSITCYSGAKRQDLDMTMLQHSGSLATISSQIDYRVSPTNSNVAIVTVSYL
ncbi:fimbrial protein [Aeromonas schubertii]|uniref:Fimbrial protein n=1 Tax=Aeromonas schubertii TaxID=652 RepID=A0A0S2SFE3_9GAMM|nr:fimbrial protein [Aeromonas schubertii]ALP40423.1 fimbrial protein [Aeromonas schubertii]